MYFIIIDPRGKPTVIEAINGLDAQRKYDEKVYISNGEFSTYGFEDIEACRSFLFKICFLNI